MALTLTQIFLAILSLITFWILQKVYEIFIRPELSPLARLPGPKRPEWMWGSMKEIFRSPPGDWHERHLETFGGVMVYKGFMNTNRLCCIDPKGLVHLLTKYDIYQKPPQVRKGLGRILGDGLLFAEGDHHRKLRKIMNPGFSTGHIRTLLPSFYRVANDVKETWLKLLPPPGSEKRRGPINILDMMTRMALDIIGLTGFDYHFDALNLENQDELAAAFASVLNHPGSFGWWDIIINWVKILEYVPTDKERRTNHAVATLRRVGKGLIEKKKQEILGEGVKDAIVGKDFLSLLIRANMDPDVKPQDKLSEEDVLGQISTFVIAGHETTSTTLSWTFLTLALHPEVQDKLREECLAVGPEPDMDVLESLKYLDAVVRESLRYNSIVPSSIRTCMKDDVIPLSDGSSIRVQKGDGIFIPIVVLNRMKSLWGEDAHFFKPERWMAPNSPPAAVKQIPGIWSDMMTFLGGPRSCIGVKFAVIEMKAVLHTIISNFKLDKVNETDEFVPRTTIVTRPLLKGRENEGNMMPLGVEYVGGW